MNNKIPFRTIRCAVLLLCLLAIYSVYSQPVFASLDQQDHDDLYESLQILSTGWFPEHVDRANQILSNTSYSVADWEEFFTEYFGANSFTSNLRNYLGYPTFWWFGDEVHLNLQLGLLGPLVSNIDTIMSDHQTDLGLALDTDADLRQTLLNSHQFLNNMLTVGVIDDSAKTQVYDFYTQHVEAYHQLWKKSVTVDVEEQPYIATIRAQIYMNLGDALPLTVNRKSEIAETIDLTGAYLSIWANHSVLVIDNNGLDANQLAVIDTHLNEIPAALHDLRYITVNSLLGNEGTRYRGLVQSSGVNIFDTALGGVVENGFPNDVDPKYADLFSLVLAHEINHVVDAYFSNNDATLANRKNDLIEAAGDLHMNYLRSMLEDGFFTTAPQEFFASISNQWFADSAHTLQLGRVRWENGYQDPINQFLFFAEIYAQGGAAVPFYTIDEYGTLTRMMIPIQRDSNGHISELTVDGETHRFVLDDDGNVISIAPFLDFDGDGVTDTPDADDDNDGIPDTIDGGAKDLDTDGDGINDVLEAGGTDANGDGLADGTDSDGDGMIDTPILNPIHSDDDDRPDYLDKDSDNDGLGDLYEDDRNSDDALGDFDGDGIDIYNDGDEGNYGDLNDRTTFIDSDNDGIADFRDTDSDNDGVLDQDEGKIFGGSAGCEGCWSWLDADSDGIANQRDPDDDNDGVPTSAEDLNGNSDFFDDDTDGDSTSDFLDRDDDGDGLPTLDESGDPDGDSIPAYLDSDGDTAGATQDGIEFRLGYSSGVYTVYMRPSTTPAAPNQTLTAQVTIKTPHGTGATRFVVDGLSNLVSGTQWGQTSRVDAPSEAPEADYISFDLNFPSGAHDAFNWSSGQEVAVFSFRNANGCTGILALLDDSDPFTQQPNSASTNPSNQIDVLGLGSSNAYIGNYGTGRADCTQHQLALRFFLRGAYESDTGLMRDALRQLSDFPTTEPYSVLPGFTPVGAGGGETINASVLAVSGDDAIVDWVWVELRDTSDPTQVLSTRAALVQRDGDIVDTDGVSAVRFAATDDITAYVAVRHRNHLGVMSAAPVTLSATPVTIDVTAAATATYGTHARLTLDTTSYGWSGDINGDEAITMDGPGNDFNQYLQTVLTAPDNLAQNRNHVLYGYRTGDLNLDGALSIAGPNNDFNALYASILLHPDNEEGNRNHAIYGQLP